MPYSVSLMFPILVGNTVYGFGGSWKDSWMTMELPTAPTTAAPTTSPSYYIAPGDYQQEFDAYDSSQWALCTDANTNQAAYPGFRGFDYNITVSCCEMDGSDGARPDCDAYPATHAEAKAICENNGYRLCTLQELLWGRITRDEGCSFDTAYSWTSDECGTNPSTDPTASPSNDPTASPSTDPTASPSNDPTASPISDSTASTPLEWIGANPGTLGNCQGDCDNDNSCTGDLICWQRGNTDSDPIPGCSGDLLAIDSANNDPGTDYCYVPTATVITATTADPTASPSTDPTASAASGSFVEEDGYLLIERHLDVANGYFSSDVKSTGLENENDPTANTYCIIGAVNESEYRQIGGYFDLKLMYRYSDGTDDVLKWTQTSWITEGTITGANLSKIEDDESDGDTPNWSFNGLGLASSAQNYLDGSGSSH